MRQRRKPIIVANVRLLYFSLERVLGAFAGLGEVRVGALDDGVLVAVWKLTLHRVIARLVTLVGLERAFAAVRIILQVIGCMSGHELPPEWAGIKSITASSLVRNFAPSNGFKAVIMCRPAWRLEMKLVWILAGILLCGTLVFAQEQAPSSGTSTSHSSRKNTERHHAKVHHRNTHRNHHKKSQPAEI